MIFFQIPLSSSQLDQSGWVDPHDMTPEYDPNYFSPNNLQETSVTVIKTENGCEETDLQSKAYLKRTINLILNAVHEDTFDEDLYKGHLIINIDSKKYKLLKDFTNDLFNDLTVIDKILTEILNRPSYDYLQEYFKSSLFKLFALLTSRTSVLCICAMCYCFVIYKMMVGHFRILYIVKFLLINLLIFDFVFVWFRLYQVRTIFYFLQRVINP